MRAYKSALLHDKITKAGQAVFDEPVMARAKPPTPIEAAVWDIFGTRAKKDLLLGHKRSFLNWISPAKVLEKKR